MVPPIPSDVSQIGRSASGDAYLFPSDEELTQRALWVAFLIVIGWTILGLGGALPLYLVSTPCLAQLGNSAVFGGSYSTLQDLSLLRLLKLFDSGEFQTANLSTLKRAEPHNDVYHARVRVIVLTALTLVLGVLPALWKIVKEFNRGVAYRKRWVEVRCEGNEMGWLGATKAPGFVGWGEKRLKDFILKSGLSSGFEARSGIGRNGARLRNRDNRSRRRGEEQPLNTTEEANLEIDIQSLFSIS